MINSSSNFKESPDPHPPGYSTAEGGEQLLRGEGRGPGLAGTLWRPAAEGATAAVLRFFPAVSRPVSAVSAPPPEAPPPLLRRGAVSSPPLAWLVFSAAILTCEDIFPKSVYRGPRLDDPLSVALGGPHYCGGVERRGRDG